MGAERHAEGELAVSPGSAGERQVGEIGAGDEQQHADRGE